MSRKEIDPAIQAAAERYAARFSKGTAVAHFIVLWREDGEFQGRIEYAEKRARSWAYQCGGECFAVLPNTGQSGATVAHVKPLTERQWRVWLVGRR